MKREIHKFLCLFLAFSRIQKSRKVWPLVLKFLAKIHEILVNNSEHGFSLYQLFSDRTMFASIFKESSILQFCTLPKSGFTVPIRWYSTDTIGIRTIGICT